MAGIGKAAEIGIRYAPQIMTSLAPIIQALGNRTAPSNTGNAQDPRTALFNHDVEVQRQWLRDHPVDPPAVINPPVENDPLSEEDKSGDEIDISSGESAEDEPFTGDPLGTEGKKYYDARRKRDEHVQKINDKGYKPINQDEGGESDIDEGDDINDDINDPEILDDDYRRERVDEIIEREAVNHPEIRGDINYRNWIANLLVYGAIHSGGVMAGITAVLDIGGDLYSIYNLWLESHWGTDGGGVITDPSFVIPVGPKPGDDGPIITDPPSVEKQIEEIEKKPLPKHCQRFIYYDQETKKMKEEMICIDEFGTRHHH